MEVFWDHLMLGTQIQGRPQTTELFLWPLISTQNPIISLWQGPAPLSKGHCSRLDPMGLRQAALLQGPYKNNGVSGGDRWSQSQCEVSILHNHTHPCWEKPLKTLAEPNATSSGVPRPGPTCLFMPHVPTCSGPHKLTASPSLGGRFPSTHPVQSGLAFPDTAWDAVKVLSPCRTQSTGHRVSRAVRADGIWGPQGHVCLMAGLCRVLFQVCLSLGRQTS